MNETDKIIEAYEETDSLRGTAKRVGCSYSKVRKTLLSQEIYPYSESIRTAQICKLKADGLSTSEIAKIVNLSEKAVNAHLPYQRGVVYGAADASKTAIKLRERRKKSKRKESE